MKMSDQLKRSGSLLDATSAIGNWRALAPDGTKGVGRLSVSPVNSVRALVDRIKGSA